MARQYLKYSIMLLTLVSFPVKHASANPLKLIDGRAYSLSDFILNDLQVKRGQPYDEKKDPALRRGSENWEQSQGGYFVVPGVLVAIIGLFLFFTRDKSD